LNSVIVVLVIVVPPMQRGTLDRIVDLLGYLLVLGYVVLSGLGIGIGAEVSRIKLKISCGCGSNGSWQTGRHRSGVMKLIELIDIRWG
jgi:hypothetical protein